MPNIIKIIPKNEKSLEEYYKMRQERKYLSKERYGDIYSLAVTKEKNNDVNKKKVT